MTPNRRTAAKAPAANRSTGRVAVLGAGSWGTTFAKIVADGGSPVTLWARRPEQAKEISEAKRNSSYLPGINLPRSLQATSDLAQALRGADQVFISLPSQSVRENLVDIGRYLEPGAIVVSLMKGIEKGSGLRMSEVIETGLKVAPELIAVASGPNIALEIAREQPTAAVISSISSETAQKIAVTATNRYFRSFINTDVIGTEFGGVLKNLIALAIGIVDGVGHGENTKATIITRGLVEMTEFSVAYGGRADTLSGLAGLGDLIATCQSPLSRNNTAGRLLGQGYTLADVMASMEQTAEGLSSVEPVLTLARARGVAMPIAHQVGQVLAGTLDPRELAPHLTTNPDEPQGERMIDDSQTHGGTTFWGTLKRAFGQLRHGGGSAPRA
ncbi:NAD(P)H-dependent glycerol-3-phosphate dehydrogenase [Homoserinimonas sp. OAct 916]|uniref:NAD(P)H-dependent glycerol-3-phosphate dehydrogenase n=1 Tax=Homoserinimonas sp. OAct 916 TaxID=2211450 RepID=UPI001E63FDE5|nr:NAD(P)H-dependent glycerol-3-phosphate dehydrogenase [Homoserinimonas sp. OAct 916]